VGEEQMLIAVVLKKDGEIIGIAGVLDLGPGERNLAGGAVGRGEAGAASTGSSFGALKPPFPVAGTFSASRAAKMRARSVSGETL